MFLLVSPSFSLLMFSAQDPSGHLESFLKIFTSLPSVLFCSPFFRTSSWTNQGAVQVRLKSNLLISLPLNSEPSSPHLQSLCLPFLLPQFLFRLYLFDLHKSASHSDCPFSEPFIPLEFFPRSTTPIQHSPPVLQHSFHPSLSPCSCLLHYLIFQ